MGEKIKKRGLHRGGGERFTSPGELAVQNWRKLGGVVHERKSSKISGTQGCDKGCEFVGCTEEGSWRLNFVSGRCINMSWGGNDAGGKGRYCPCVKQPGNNNKIKLQGLGGRLKRRCGQEILADLVGKKGRRGVNIKIGPGVRKSG